MAAKASARGSFANFRYGYHAIPSMSLLHMHVISQDFVSDSLKTVRMLLRETNKNQNFVLQKKHWNSFTTDYFLDAADVIDDLQANGAVRVDTERMKKLLNQDLQCHRCSSNLKTMPALKQHLLTHT